MKGPPTGYHIHSKGFFIELGRIWHGERDAAWKKVWQEGWSVKVMNSEQGELTAVVYTDFDHKKLYSIYPSVFAAVVQKYIADTCPEIQVQIVASNAAFTTFGFRVPFARFDAQIQEIAGADQDFDAAKSQTKINRENGQQQSI